MTTDVDVRASCLNAHPLFCLFVQQFVLKLSLLLLHLYTCAKG